jgi:hypothetical protein
LKRLILLAAVALLIITVVATVLVTSNMLSGSDQEFYVGVTYCGDTVAGAEQLIDKVKNYTNLFVLQSGTLLRNVEAINAIGDYAVNAGLHYIAYFGTDSAWVMKTWRESYNGSWGDNFLGIYFGDEPGGKMLDSDKGFYDQTTQDWITKNSLEVQWGINNNTHAAYGRDGTITLTVSQPFDTSLTNFYHVKYYPNGTVTNTTYTAQKDPQNPNQTSLNPTIVIVKNHSTLNYTYQELYNSRPFQSVQETAQRFVNATKSALNNFGPVNGSYLTSDYGLYWYDYLGGYDSVLAQLGWNHTAVQDIALVRGAANLQGKDWGTVITWKYNQTPYLASGDEIYDQMRLSFECGANYAVIFNYAPNMTEPYGTLQPEHFEALQHFWNDIQNGNIKQGTVKADTAFVLPHNYGSGLRQQDDIIWGLWTANSTDRQIWQRMQTALSVHGEKLDIIYEDSAYPPGKYSQIIYWNQTGS